MRIGIIGAGFTGLSSGYRLSKQGHTVTIFEKDTHPGGLAVGFRGENWQWSLEKHYHHFFTNDKNALALAEEIGQKVLTKRPKTSVYLEEKIYQLDSPKSILKFPKLSFFKNIRMAMVLAFLKFNPVWQPFEKIKAEKFLKNTMGKDAYETLWKPQLVGKFGKFSEEISLAWFWARIKKRTSSLSYPETGFLHFAEKLAQEIEKMQGKVLFDAEILKIKSTDNAEILYKTKRGEEKMETFDKIIVTLPSFFFLKLADDLPKEYIAKLQKLKGLGAINLVLRLKDNFLKDNTYWLSICEKNAPILAIVEHTNFIDKKYYDNEHIVYLGNYLPYDHKYFKLTANELLKIYDPFLKKINKDYKKTFIAAEIFKAPFAQPIIPTNYSKIIPPFETPLKNVFLANIQQVYPWDRGTNYAIELGEKVSERITRNA